MVQVRYGQMRKSGPCNFTTIGSVFALLGIAVRHGRGVYRKA